MRAKRGFTLVELLVVIGIIAVLISILLPSLNKARASADNVKCLSNLRQLGFACQAYISDNHGVLPPVASRSASYYKQFWPQALASTKYVSIRDINDSTPTAKGRSTNTVFTCPSGVASSYPGFENGNVGAIAGLRQTQDLAQHNFVGPSADKFPFVSSNYMANGLMDTNGANFSKVFQGRQLGDYFPFCIYPRASDLALGYPDASPSKLSSCRESSKLMLISDGIYAHDRGAKSFTLRHGNLNGPITERRCNMVFLDGHADSMIANEIPCETLGDSAGTIDTMTWNNITPTHILNTNANGRWKIRLIIKNWF